MLIGNVGLFVRKNGDRSRTIYLHWITSEDGSRKQNLDRFGRTEPRPTRSSLRKTLSLARAEARILQGELKGNQPARKRWVISIPDAIEFYTQWIAGDDRHDAVLARTTIDAHIRVLEHFLKFVGEEFPGIRMMWRLSSAHIARWRDARRKQIKDSTLLSECTALQAFLHFADNRGWTWARFVAMPKDERRRLSNRPKQRVVVMSSNRLSKLLDSQEDQFRRDCLFVLAATGMRQGELRFLPRTAWDANAMTITIPPGLERTKRHGRILPVGPETTEAIERLHKTSLGRATLIIWKDKPLTTQMNTWLRGWKCTPHDFRRWFISTLEGLECPEYVIQDLVGHSRPKTRRAYAQEISVEQRRSWLVRVEKKLAR